MPSTINRVPFGLQDLLGSTNQGDNPNQLGGVVAPTLDVGRLLKVERRSFHVVVQSFTNSAILATIQVPLGQLWLVDSVGVRVNPTAAPTSAISCNIGVEVINANNANLQASMAIAGWKIDWDSPTALTSLGVQNRTQRFESELPLFGNESVRFRSGGLNGTANFTADCVVQFTRLNI